MPEPVRKIGKNHRSITGTLASDKAGGGAAYESALERDYYLQLEFDPSVISIAPQPVTIFYRDALGRRRKYTPDVLIGHADIRPPALREVKYAAEVRAKREEYRVKFRAARDYAREQGWTFGLVTEHAIRAPLLKNAHFLSPYRDTARTFPQAQQSVLLSALARLGTATPHLLLAAFPEGERALLLPTLWHLVASRRIGADLERPFNMHSPIKVPHD